MSPKQKSVYLTLDDLYKLYGIAPELIFGRKKKKRKKAKIKSPLNLVLVLIKNLAEEQQVDRQESE